MMEYFEFNDIRELKDYVRCSIDKFQEVMYLKMTQPMSIGINMDKFGIQLDAKLRSCSSW
jgi:hypothetical protein